MFDGRAIASMMSKPRDASTVKCSDLAPRLHFVSHRILAISIFLVKDSK